MRTFANAIILGLKNLNSEPSKISAHLDSRAFLGNMDMQPSGSEQMDNYQSQRKRAFRTRSRTGCNTCRFVISATVYSSPLGNTKSVELLEFAESDVTSKSRPVFAAPQLGESVTDTETTQASLRSRILTIPRRTLMPCPLSPADCKSLYLEMTAESSAATTSSSRLQLRPWQESSTPTSGSFNSHKCVT